MRVLIAGGGIGGLSAALALHAAGIEATVLESARELRPLGVGINLLPDAVAELIALGLGDRLAEIGIATAEHVYVDRFGGELFTEPRGLAAGQHAPQYSVHRGRLQMMLLDAVRDRLGDAAIHTGARVTTFEQAGGEVRVDAGESTLTADILVGADGIHSTIRAQLHPINDPLRWSGVQMWRGVTPGAPFLTGRSAVLARGPEHAEIIVYPIGADEINWVAMLPVGAPGLLPGSANWNTPGRVDDILPHLDWDLGWLNIGNLLRDSTSLFEYPMTDKDPLPFWGAGHVTLLGDAAHPMYPVGANGGTQAILDATALAAAIRADGVAGLAVYERIRRTATTQVVRANRAMQRTSNEFRPTELARITTTYREQTTQHAGTTH
ncbi:FAD-dependent monooxygenase [Nocardia sp. NPDC052566]|uniref:FAD-dependent monooxygenase n=1 Tax=Nocardia sp. NPDC052566 TaxID=3364330 RepID=UPI0037C80B1B